MTPDVTPTGPRGEGTFKLTPRLELKGPTGTDSGERRVRREPLLKSPLRSRDDSQEELPEDSREAEVARLQTLVEALESQNQTLQAQLARQQQPGGEDRARQLEDELARARAVAEERSRSVTALELERETLRKEAQHLTASLAEHQQRVGALEQQLQRNNLELTYAASELNRLSQAESGAQELAEKARLLESELGDARRDLGLARSRISAIQTEMVGKDSRYLKLEQEFEELSRRVAPGEASGERQLADMRSALAQRDKRLQELEAQHASWSQRWEAELQRAGARVNQLNEAIAARDRRIGELEAQLAQPGRSGADPTAAAAELMAARVELSSLRRNAEVARLNSVKLESELNEARAAFQRSQAGIASLERQIKELQLQREALEHRLSEGRVVLEELRAENGSLRSQLNEAVRRLELAQRAFSGTPGAADSAEVARLQAQIKHLESEVVSIMVKLSASEKERMELEQRLRESSH